MDYATQLLLQRGRDAGGIAVELVELIEETSENFVDAAQLENEIERLENRIEKLNDELEAADEDLEKEEKKSSEAMACAHSLADALHLALRHNDLPTATKCREVLEKFREKHPRES